MNNTRGSWCLDTLSDCPLTDLIRTRGEETGQVENLAHGGDHLGKTRLGTDLLAFFLDGSFVAHKSQALFEACRDGDQRLPARVSLDPLEDLGKVLVLLAEIVLLAQVDQVDRRLGCQKEEGVDNFHLIIIVSCNPAGHNAELVSIKLTMKGKSGGTSSHVTSTLEL